MGEWRRAGVIVNPMAGASEASSLKSSRIAVEQLGIRVVMTGDGRLGRDAFGGWAGDLQTRSIGNLSAREQTHALTRWVADQGVEVLIVSGGDGTLADAAQALAERKSQIPILGLGSGSTNVGQLVTCRAERAGELDPCQLETWSVHCLLAEVNQCELGIAFNDVVLGRTVVGTIGGIRRDLDASARLQGRAMPAAPRSIGSNASRVTRIAGEQRVTVASGEEVACVVVGLAESAFFGKAVTGGACLASAAGLPAGCIVADVPLVQIEIDKSELSAMPPIASKFVSLSGDQCIEVEGVEGACLCVDGNARHIAEKADRMRVTVRCNAVVGVRSRKDLRST